MCSNKKGLRQVVREEEPLTFFFPFLFMPCLVVDQFNAEKIHFHYHKLHLEVLLLLSIII
jgi:hypothetical protein